MQACARLTDNPRNSLGQASRLPGGKPVKVFRPATQQTRGLLAARRLDSGFPPGSREPRPSGSLGLSVSRAKACIHQGGCRVVVVAFCVAASCTVAVGSQSVGVDYLLSGSQGPHSKESAASGTCFARSAVRCIGNRLRSSARGSHRKVVSLVRVVPRGLWLARAACRSVYLGRSSPARVDFEAGFGPARGRFCGIAPGGLSRACIRKGAGKGLSPERSTRLAFARAFFEPAQDFPGLLRKGRCPGWSVEFPEVGPRKGDRFW
jgi:hypothetical protein